MEFDYDTRRSESSFVDYGQWSLGQNVVTSRGYAFTKAVHLDSNCHSTQLDDINLDSK